MNEISAAMPQHLMAAPEERVQAKNTMGKDDFLLLLMTQLQHQDPMKPMDHYEFATQLAQFSQLEQLTNIGGGIKDLRQDMGGESKLQALSMIGKRVDAAGSEIDLISGKTVSLVPNQKEGVKLTKASIYDVTGKLVREIDLSRQSSDEPIRWDGKSQDGIALPSGRYTFRVGGVDSKGEAKEIGTEISGKVVGVNFEGGAPVLVVETANGRSQIGLQKVRRVDTGEEKKPEATAGNKEPVKVSTGMPPVTMAQEAKAPDQEAAPEEEADPIPSWEFTDHFIRPPGGG